MFRKLLIAIVLLLIPSIAHAQLTTVTGTIVDANGNPYANGTVSTFLVTQAGVKYTFGGSPVNPSTGPFPTDATGHFSITLPPNSLITPTDSAWTFNICAQSVNLGPQAPNPTQICFTTGPIFIVTPGPQDVSIAVNAFSKILGPHIGSGGGSPPVGNNGDIQSKFGTNFAATCLNDNGTIITSCRPLSVGAAFYNTATVSITGPTPSVAGGNVFTLSNGGATTVTNLLNGSDSQLVTINCSDVNSTFANNSNIVTVTGSATACGLNQPLEFVFNGSLLKWIQIGNPSGGGGGGGSPSGNNGDLQSKNGASFGASGENDNGTTFKVNRDAEGCGPNPSFDVRCFGARMITGTAPSTTATISSGSAVATLAAASTFQNGDGVLIRGAGPTPTMATPAAPTVTPSNSGTTTMTGSFTANTSGATTYQYQVVAVDVLRGVTVASTATVITNGPATLGSQTVNISSWTRSNNIVSVVTASPHNLVPGAGFSINPGTDGSIAGAFVVSTAADNTHFTFQMGLDTRNGAPTSGGNTGIITYYMANHVTIASVAGAQMYLIYGRTAGSMALIGATLPETSFTTDPLYNDWDDYGSTITAVQLGNWAPATPPVAVKNQDLVSTIVSGAGTTTITLANTASNNATAQSILFDNSIALVNDMIAARNGAGIVYIPCTSAANGFLVLNAVTLLNPSPSFVSIQQCGGVAAGDTIKIGQTQWNGVRSPAKGGSFAFDQYPNITSSTAYPVIWSAGQWKMSYVSINGSNNGVIWADDGAGTIPGFQMDHVNLIAGGASDFIGRAFICRTSIIGGSDVLMDHITMVPGTGVSATPVMIFTSVPGMTTLSNFMINRRALYFGTNTNGIGPLLIQQIYCQGCIMPKITVENTAGVGNAGVSMTITGSIEDTSNWPVIAVASGGMSGLIKIFNTNGIIGPLTTGSPGPSFQLTNAGGSTQNVSDNIGVVNGPTIYNEVDGIFTNNGAQPLATVKQDAALSIGTPYQTYVNSLPQPAPTCSVSAGGSVSIGAKTFVVFPVFSTGGEGSPSAVSPTCTTSSGQQTVTIGWTVVPGAIGYDIFVNGFSISGAASPMVAGGSTVSFVFSGGGGGQSQPQASGTGPTVMASDGIHANKAFLSSTAGTGVATLDPTSITANRNYTFPDLSGALLINPMTTIGDLIGGGASGAPTRIVAGTTGQALVATTGATPAFSSASITNNAATASALAGSPSICGAGQVAAGIVANGNATGCTNAGVGFGSNVVVAAVLPGGNVQMLNATTTNGSPNFSSATANWDSSMVGYIIRANSSATANLFPLGTTVLSVTDSTHAVASANATGTSPGTASIGLYPRDETATINAAIGTALSVENCGTVVIPRGVYLITSTFSNLLPTLPAGCTNWGNGAGPFFQIVGFPTSIQGKATSITIPPDFDWTTCTGAGGSTCFPNIRASDFTFNGQSFDALPAGAQNKILVNGSAQNFGVHHLGSPAIAGFKSFTLAGAGAGCRRCFFDNTGPVDWGGFFGTFSGYIEGTAYMMLSSNGQLQMGSDGTQINGILATSGAAQVFCATGAILSFNSISGSSSVFKSTTTGPILWIDGCQISTSGAGSAFLATVGNNLTIHSTHGTWSGTPTNLFNGDIRYYDECGNGLPLGSQASWTGTYNGDCSITGTALATGNVALTSGWDTSTKGTFSGSSRKGQFTVTLAGAPTSPAVITITFPVAFRFVAPVCYMVFAGGTNAAPTSIATGTVTTTTAAFTVNHTPVAGNTETFIYDCSVP